MVQFVKGGPDIPEGLLRDHEEGRVIFFCGAGISCQAGLPDFGELAGLCYKVLCTKCTSEQRKAIKSKQYDKAFKLLERALGSYRIEVRRTIAKRLHEHREHRELNTHGALLDLAQYQNRRRLITTNFDRLFEEAAKDTNDPKIDYCDPATILSDGVHTWDSVVYLHGRLPELPPIDGDKSYDNQLDRLVLTSSDFARAYLMGRQVTDFIQHLLFLHHTICFVGYSLEDIMFQYLLDGCHIPSIRSSDKGSSSPGLYAFVSEDAAGTSREKCMELGVQPISYYCKKTKDKLKKHAFLHDTLRAWAQSMGVKGKTKVIDDSIRKAPSDSTPKDDFVGRVLWALKDTSGKPAEHFASLTPVPSLEWLVTSRSVIDVNGARSQIPVSLFDDLSIDNHNDVIKPLSRWLAHHLEDDPYVLVWLTKQRQELRQRIVLYIQAYLRPKDEPGSPLELKAQQYWQLFLGGHVLHKQRDCTKPLNWQTLLTKNKLTLASKIHLLNILKPILELKLSEITLPKSRIRSFNNVGCELCHVSTYDIGGLYWRTIRDRDNGRSTWQNEKALAELFPDFNKLLHEGLDLLFMAGAIDHEHDRSYVARPSLSDWELDENKDSWSPVDALGLYITLTRNAWLAKNAQSLKQSEAAKADAIQWMREPYPAFKRLAFFAATRSAFIEPQQALEWLLEDDRAWLWSGDTRREAIRLIAYLASLASKPNTADIGRLEQAILKEPPQLNHWDICECDVYLRLARLEKYLPTGTDLGDDAQDKLNALREKYPEWQDDPDENAESPRKYYVWGTDRLKDKQKHYNINPAHWSRAQWTQWIQEHPTIDFDKEKDGWSKFCDTHFLDAVHVLGVLPKNDVRFAVRWHKALCAWMSPQHSKRIHRLWRRVSLLLEKASNNMLLSLDIDVGEWIFEVAKQDAIAPHDEALLIRLSNRLLALPNAQSDIAVTTGRQLASNDVSQSLSKGIDYLSQALLIYWCKQQPKNNRSLPATFKNLFTQMCDVRQESFRRARVTLGRKVLLLLDIEPKWTNKNLLPLFNWNRDPEHHSDACAVWQGCLTEGIPVLSLPDVIRSHFLTAAKHDLALGHHATVQYCNQFINTVTSAQPIFTDKECKQAIASLSLEGRAKLVAELSGRLCVSQGQDTVTTTWDNEIAPFFERVWPREARYHSPDIAREMLWCCDCAGERSEQARKLLAPYIEPHIQSHTQPDVE